MSISKSLLRAAKLQEKIDLLRGQLSDLLDKARVEIASSSVEEATIAVRRVRPKMLISGRNPRAVRTPLPSAPRKAGRLGKAAPSVKPARRSPLAGQKRATSPSGPLAPAVVKVLQTKKQAMNVRDILGGLLANGYHFNSADPKKNLAARIYRLKGVKQVSSGLFSLA